MLVFAGVDFGLAVPRLFEAVGVEGNRGRGSVIESRI